MVKVYSVEVLIEHNGDAQSAREALDELLRDSGLSAWTTSVEETEG